MTTTDRLESLAGLIDLSAIPMSEPGGRLLVRMHSDRRAIQVTSAVYEQPPDECGPIHALRFLDENGDPLEISAATRPDRLDLDIAGQRAVVAFIEPSILMVQLPGGRARMALDLVVGDDHRAPGLDVGPGFATGRIDGRGREEPYSFVLMASVLRHERGEDGNGRPRISIEMDAAPGDMLVIGCGPDALDMSAPFEPSVVLMAAAERWRRRLDQVPLTGAEESEPALRAAWVLATNTVRLKLEPTTAAVVPSKMGYVALWQWDSYFHAIGLRHLDCAAARDQLRLALHWQQPDGLLPDVVHDHGVVAASDDMEEEDRARSLIHVGRKATDHRGQFLSAPLTKPPLIALAAWKVFEADPDPTFLAEVYPAIVRSHRWWFERSRPNGRDLPIYLHPYSSGADDSPLWDQGMPVVTPDLPAYLALQADHLALMASVLGLEEEAEAWRSEARSITQRLVARHWRVRQGAFVSFFRNRPVPADTVIGLLPIVTGRLPLDVARQLVATMEDPERFWSTFPVPSVALSDPEFDPTHMWRGPTWLFTDYLLVDGLRRSGFGDAAERLRERTVRMVEQDAGTPEFFHPVLGRRPDMATATFSGTAALYLELVLGARV